VGVKSLRSRRSGADPLGEGALWIQLYFQGAVDELLFEGLILSHVARDHFFDLSGL
jgi:hypothetical protein